MIPKDELDKAVQIATKYGVGEVYLIGLETIRQILRAENIYEF